MIETEISRNRGVGHYFPHDEWQLFRMGLAAEKPGFGNESFSADQSGSAMPRGGVDSEYHAAISKFLFAGAEMRISRVSG